MIMHYIEGVRVRVAVGVGVGVGVVVMASLGLSALWKEMRKRKSVMSKQQLQV